MEAARAGGHTSWGYHSPASLTHRYVAMTVPKVACTTIKMALQTWEGCGPPPQRWADMHASWAGPTLLAYPTAQVVEMLRSPDYLRISFVRNPYGVRSRELAFVRAHRARKAPKGMLPSQFRRPAGGPAYCPHACPTSSHRH